MHADNQYGTRPFVAERKIEQYPLPSPLQSNHPSTHPSIHSAALTRNSNPTLWSPNRIKPPTLLLDLRVKSKGIKPIDTHSVDIIIAREIEPDDNNEIGEDEDQAFEVVAFAFAVDV